jgi:NADH-quinone oxidoreductase subunit C
MIDHSQLLQTLRADFGPDLLSLEGAGDDAVLRANPARVHELLEALKNRHGFNVLVDLTAVDRLKLGDNAPRFEVVYRLMSLDPGEGLSNARLAVKIRLNDGQAVPRSAKDLWPVADWLEREVWDMFGIPFADRPGMKRLLMYEEFKGHPLRKDYPIAKRQPLIGPPSGELADNPSFNAPVPTITAD